MDENNNDINEVQPPVDEPVTATPQPEATTFNTDSDPVSEPVNNAAPNSGKKLPIIPIVAVVVVVLLLLLVGLGGSAKKPDKFFKDLLGGGFDLFVNTANSERTDNMKVSLDAELDLGEDMSFFTDSTYGKLITTTKPEISVYTGDQKIEADVHANYDGEDLLNASMILDMKDKKGVFQVKEISDSYFDLELDEDTFETFDEMLAGEKKIPQERVNIVKEEVNKKIVSEHATKASEKIEVDGKTVNTTCYTYKTDLESIYDAMIDVCKELKDNEKYLKTFEDDENPKDVLDDTIDTLKSGNYSDEDIVEIKVYVDGKKFVKCLVSLTGEDETVVEISVVSPKKGVYNYEFVSKASADDDEPETFTGTVTVEKDGNKKGTVTVSGKYDEYSAKLIVNYEKLDKKDIPDVSSLDVKTMDEMSDEDVEKFTESKLYELMMDVSGYGSSSYYDDYDYSFDDEDYSDLYSSSSDDEEDSYSFDDEDYDWNF